MALLFMNDDQTDVQVVVGTGAHSCRFPAHAMVLRASPVLDDYLRRGDAVGDVPLPGTLMKDIRIPDVTPQVFEKLLRFLYKQDINLDGMLPALQLLRAANDYVVPGLFSQCLKYISASLCPENVLEVLTQISQISLKIDLHENDLNEVKSRCMELIDINAEGLLAGPLFEQLPHQLMTNVVSRSTLWIKSELSIAAALDRWAVRACHRQGLEPTDKNKRDALGLCVYQVRFFKMNKREFSDGLAASGLLEPRDVHLVLEYMNEKLSQEQLPQHLRDNLQLKKRVLPAIRQEPAGQRSSLPLSVSATLHRSQTASRTRSTSQVIKKRAGDVFWAILSFLD